MTREEDLVDSRKGLLKNEDASRRSRDDTSNSGSELDLDELEILESEPHSPRLRGGWSPLKQRKKGHQRDTSKSPSRRNGGWCRNKAWYLVTVLLIGGLVGGLGGAFGGTFTKPGLHDGASVPNGTRLSLADAL